MTASAAASSTPAATPTMMTDQNVGAGSSNDIQYSYVQEPKKDFVRNEHGDGFNVGATGRALVRTPNGKFTTQKYDPEYDAPPEDTATFIFPMNEELKGGHAIPSRRSDSGRGARQIHKG
jgi:hypothetical protein